MSNSTASKYLALSDIKIDPACQARAATNDDAIQEYVEIMKDESDDPFPPVVVFYDGTEHWLSDGFHRHAAAQRVGLHSLKVDIRRGSRRDAILYGVGANATHGLRRSNDDKRHAVTMLLGDPEWVRWSDVKIADHCKVSDRFVAKQRKDTPNGSESAARVYVHPKSGKPTTMNTAKIGKKDGLEELLSISPDRAEVPDQGWLVSPDRSAADKVNTSGTGDEPTPLPDQASTSDGIQLQDLMSAWTRASEGVQHQFLAKIGVSVAPQVEANPVLDVLPSEPEPIRLAERIREPKQSISKVPQNTLFKMWTSYKRLTQGDGLRWVEAGCPSEYQDTNLTITGKLVPFRETALAASAEEWEQFTELARRWKNGQLN